jgi:acyl carrier protein
VQDVVVSVREKGGSGKQLVAYVVPQAESPPTTTSDLRRFLQQMLPEYMIPAAFVTLETLPLTPNGKVDRRRLPGPDGARPELERPFIPPRTPSEQIIANIWSNVLRIDRVGMYDNFFELGGDSIQSIQVVARANQVGFQLSPTQVFQYPTVAGLAQLASTTVSVQAEQDIVTGPIPLTPIQHWFFEHPIPQPHHWNWAFLHEVRHNLDASLLALTLRYMMRHHDALRLRFQRTDSGWRQVNAPIAHKKKNRLLIRQIKLSNNSL